MSIRFKQVTFEKYNGPLTLTSTSIPGLSPTQVLIAVKACSINPIDYKRYHGDTAMILKDTFPAPIGYDIAGVVEQIGARVEKFKIGERVFVRSELPGALAEKAVVEQEELSSLPDKVGFVDAAAIPLAGMTALQALRAGGILKGCTVFVSGGAGGVGTYAVQLAKHVFQASRVVTTCSGPKVEFCKSIGADGVVDYTKGNTYVAAQEQYGKFDVVFDTVGDASKMGVLMKPGNKLVSVGSTPDPGSFERSGSKRYSAGFALRSLLYLLSTRERWGASPGVYEYMWLNQNAKDLSELGEYLQDGRVKSIIDSTYVGLEKSEEALKHLATGRAKGKVVITLE